MTHTNDFQRNTTSPAAAISHNQFVVIDLMREWNCTSLEAYGALKFDCDTLEDTRDTIAQGITHERLFKQLKAEFMHYLQTERYKDKEMPDDFLRDEAKELAEEYAYQAVYDWEDYEDYDTLSEVAKEAFVFGTREGIPQCTTLY